MPNYQYNCPKCGVIEIIKSIKAPALKKCPTCSSPVEPILSPPLLRFVGTGFYETDYKRTK